MLRKSAPVSLIMFSLAILSASADTWKDGFDNAELDERWKPADPSMEQTTHRRIGKLIMEF